VLEELRGHLNDGARDRGSGGVPAGRASRRRANRTSVAHGQLVKNLDH
jgi:hypothetical protein